LWRRKGLFLSFAGSRTPFTLKCVILTDSSHYPPWIIGLNYFFFFFFGGGRIPRIKILNPQIMMRIVRLKTSIVSKTSGANTKSPQVILMPITHGIARRIRSLVPRAAPRLISTIGSQIRTRSRVKTPRPIARRAFFHHIATSAHTG